MSAYTSWTAQVREMVLIAFIVCTGAACLGQEKTQDVQTYDLKLKPCLRGKFYIYREEYHRGSGDINPEDQRTDKKARNGNVDTTTHVLYYWATPDPEAEGKTGLRCYYRWHFPDPQDLKTRNDPTSWAVTERNRGLAKGWGGLPPTPFEVALPDKKVKVGAKWQVETALPAPLGGKGKQICSQSYVLAGKEKYKGLDVLRIEFTVKWRLGKAGPRNRHEAKGHALFCPKQGLFVKMVIKAHGSLQLGPRVISGRTRTDIALLVPRNHEGLQDAGPERGPGK
ncbi:MAG: hypothetical protein R6X33_06990 [Candidatus Brocadiia bacterium]